MAEELTPKNSVFSGTVGTLAAKALWHGLVLAAILALSAFLNLFRLTSEGYGNTYYAAAVKNMLTSWHNFFFASFDAGFVTVDKPPLGLWVQAASAYLFGFNGLSLLVPQALAAILSVALLYYLVSRTFGPVAGLVAALVLAVTPVAVAVDRTNNADGLLVLTVLVAAWAVIRAAERGSLRWLLLCATVVGLGFNIKMLEAFLVLPAFYLLYLLASPVNWWRRFVHLGLATLVLLVVSLSWAVVVDLTPTDQRPYVGSSFNNSELGLAVGYNGVLRLMGLSSVAGGSMPTGAQEGPPGGAGFGPFGTLETGAPGPFRLLDEQLAGQIGWLLPLSVVGLLVASWQQRPHLPLDRKHQALVLWGMWLLTITVFFSIAGMFHRYYLVMLAPAVAALAGAGVVALWNDYRSPNWRGWLLPLTLLGTAALHAYIILAYYEEDWSRWLTAAIAVLCSVVAVGLIGLRLKPRLKVGAYSVGAVVVGILAILIAPTVWAAYTVWQGSEMLPAAGPQTAQGSFWSEMGGGPPGAGPAGGGARGSGPLGSRADPALVDYLEANRGDAKYLVATTNALSASPIILNTDEPVISMGGFIGFDQVLTPNELSKLVDKGEVRFFLVPDWDRMKEMFSEMMAQASTSDSSQLSSPLEDLPSPSGEANGPPEFLQNAAANWVEDNCEQVPQELWQSAPPDQEEGVEQFMSAQVLYDCGARAG